IPIFHGLSDELIGQLLEQIVYQRAQYPPASLVISQGEPCNRLLILMEGMVKGEMTGPGGKSLKIEDMEAPAVLAPAFLFGQHQHFPVNIVTLSDCKFLIIRSAELLRLFKLNQQVLQNFLSMISSRAQFLSEKLRFHSFKSLKAKLAFYLLNEAGSMKTFKLRHSQNELAELMGVARPSVGRVFLQLQEEGLVDVRYRQVEIRDRQRLVLACNET
ncbi:MAG: Crp/Fnr family transcriptional regulator, partial [Prolixibacteraceae bacterium]|nr:Crp/Fnr family transcriptional regulator [Prolixibacteraceae bacterium]